MADTVGRYPQSTPDGQAIPFEIIRPLGLLVQPFNGVAVNAVALPSDADYLVLRAVGASCYIHLGGNVAVPAAGVHTLGVVYIGDGEVIVIDHNAAATISVIRAAAEDGTLIVQTGTKYKDIRKSAQLERS